MSRPARRTPRILVVDDDPGLLRLLTIRLRSQNFVVEPVDGSAKALAAVSRFRPDLVVTDLRMAEMDGIALLRELQRRWPSLNVIMLTAHGTIPDAVKATQSGAFSFLTKPVEKDQLLDEVRRALKTSGFTDAGGDDWRAEFATRSPLMEEQLAKAHMVAGSEVAVLITGEPGTGKELLAKAIHRASARHDAAFVAIDCGTLAAASGEAEIAAAVSRAGAGTLHLRDVNDLPQPLGPSLIRLLDSPRARIVATGDHQPEELTHEDRHVRELVDHLGAVHVELPPLGKRREDIPLLVQQCLDDVAAETSQPKRSCSPEAMELLASARWPGNVRQLRVVVRQAAATGAGAVITADQVQEAQGQVTQLPSFDEAREEFTRNYLVQLLQITQGNVTQAARLAKRNRTDFYKLLSRHGIEPESFKD
jgi:two-component system, NtrC family, response regulator GlrR